MAGGGFDIEAPVTGFDSKITVSVVITCIVAASSGLIFGYDLGISGSFISKHFPYFLFLIIPCYICSLIDFIVLIIEGVEINKLS